MSDDMPADIEMISDEIARSVGAIWDSSPIGRAILAERKRCAAWARTLWDWDSNVPAERLLSEIEGGTQIDGDQ